MQADFLGHSTVDALSKQYYRPRVLRWCAQILDQLAKGLALLKEHTRAPHEELSLVIDGKALAVLLHSRREELLRLGVACRAVICCRVSPLQKALVTRWVCRPSLLLRTSVLLGPGSWIY